VTSAHGYEQDTLNIIFTITNIWGYRSKWPRGLWYGSAAARLLGLRVRVPPESWMSVTCQRYVLSGCLCDGMISRPKESYRTWYAWVWSWNLDNEKALAYKGLLGYGKKIEVTLSSLIFEAVSEILIQL